MKLATIFLFLVLSSVAYTQQNWKDIAVIEGLEVHADTTSIQLKDNQHYAWIKTVYTTDESKSAYVDRIRKSYPKQDEKLEKKMKKWEDFSYNISYRIYDCSNKRYMTLEVTDYTSNGKKIVKTKTPKKNQRWTNVGTDTMGDYTLYFICDYDSM